MKKNSAIHNNRIIFLLIFFLLLSLIIISRLFYIQVVKGHEYTKKALEQINRSEEIVSDRGIIYDRNGKKMAVNVSASTVYVNPGAFNGDSDRAKVISELAPLVEMDEGELYYRLSSGKRTKIRQWVERDVANRILEKNLSGIEIVEDYRRFYPFGNMASHLLGFTNVDGIGQYGVEASYNSDLTGSSGRILKSSDAGNRQLPTGSREVFEADDGLSAVLTIDQGIQSVLEEETNRIIDEFKADGVQIIVQEVATGDILGMSSYPAFDSNNPTSAINEAQALKWKNMSSEEIQNNWYTNWRNPIVNNIYEPGSTFKLITAAAAIEENTTNSDKQYYCTGYIRDIKNAPPLRCVSFAHPHGDITLRDALAKSCNPSFVYVNRELGRENFLKYIKAFGFGEKTGIDLTGEAIGMIPSSSESISEIGLATMSYGHGLAVTPIQLINAVSAIGNDGILMTPRVVKELVNSEGRVVKSMEISEKRQVISSETANIMLEMMSHVVESGTASRANSAIYRIGGKTGTANKVLENGYAEDQFVSSFVGLAPIDNPVISILVIVDNPKTQTYGSIVASPSAKNIIEYTLKLLGIKEKPRDSIDTNKDYVRVPDVTFRLIGEAGRMITDTDLKYTTEYVNITDDTIIISQNPKAGELVDRGSIVEFEIDLNNGETKIVPNLLGKQINEIEEYLNKIGVGYETEGAEEGVIVRMSPNYSSRIQAGEKITLVLGEKSELQGQDTSDPSLVDGLLEVENTENRPITSPEKDKSEEVIEEINEDNNEENSPDDKPSPNA